ncbi:ABC transporter permease subunit [Salisediminibacterium halotolerans]|uniref:ABC-2 type transport system permease protein n=1 Tax=Salisediminibacterium halotolerans TaxID=517425 RepID=A0A1H9WV55_9BACI|nr:ABC transporter permease subunit [Salisediminibacterium haloalkalitolerans]SES37293.1 ABC-2 type transport system permease protein [Salisediminibacterium haloalkalitolerans]
MLTLLKNEWIKLWNKKQPWAFALLLMAITFGVAFIFQAFLFDMSDQTGEDWEQGMEQEIAMQEERLAEDNLEEWEEEDAHRIIAENEQMLAAGINPYETNNMIFLEESFGGLASFITLFSVIIASSIVSSEIDNGTMKHLLIRPFARWKLLAAKLLTVHGFLLIMLAVLVGSNLLIGTLLFGAGSFNTQIMVNNFDAASFVSSIDQILPARIGLYTLNAIVFIIISFAVSILFKSQTLAVGIGIFILFGTTIVQSFNALLGDTAWYPFVFLPHLSLTEYAVQDEILPGVGLAFSLTVLGAYVFVFLAASFTYFQRKDFTE